MQHPLQRNNLCALQWSSFYNLVRPYALGHGGLATSVGDRDKLFLPRNRLHTALIVTMAVLARSAKVSCAASAASTRAVASVRPVAFGAQLPRRFVAS